MVDDSRSCCLTDCPNSLPAVIALDRSDGMVAAMKVGVEAGSSRIVTRRDDDLTAMPDHPENGLGFELGYWLDREGLSTVTDPALEIEDHDAARNVELRAVRASVSGAPLDFLVRRNPTVRSAGVSRSLIAWASEAAGRWRRVHRSTGLLIPRWEGRVGQTQERPVVPPTVTLATNNGDMGGGEVMLLRIAETLRELGVDVSVVAPEAPAELADAATRIGLSTVRLPAEDRLQWMVALRRWDRRKRVGVLWCNGLVPAVATAGHRDRIVHLHQQPFGLHRPLTAAARARAIKVLVPSKFMQSVVPGSEVLPNWTGAIPRGQRVRGDGGPFVVGFLGRLSPDKGLVVLAEAMRLLREDKPGGIRLLVAGEPRFVADSEYAKVRAALAGIAEMVECPGWMDRDVFFSQVDMMVMPSVWDEPFGLSAAEAMAAEVPLVVSDAGALPEVVGERGLIVPSGDPARLAGTIAAVADGTVQAPTAEMRQRWAELFSPAAGERGTAAVIRSLWAHGLP